MLKDGSGIALLAMVGVGAVFCYNGIRISSTDKDLMGMPFLAMGCILIGSATLIVYWRWKRYEDGPTTDERVQWIRDRAENAGGFVLMFYWAVLCFGLFIIATVQGQQAISIDRHWPLLAFCYGYGFKGVAQLIVMRRIRKKELANGQE